jgi:hypothetical protein
MTRYLDQWIEDWCNECVEKQLRAIEEEEAATAKFLAPSINTEQVNEKNQAGIDPAGDEAKPKSSITREQANEALDSLFGGIWEEG